MYFRGYLSGSEYAKALAKCLVAYAGLPVALFLALFLVAGVGHTGSGPGTLAFAAGHIFFFLGLPLVCLVLLVSIASVVVRRLRDCNYPAILAFIPALLLAKDWRILMVFPINLYDAIVHFRVPSLSFHIASSLLLAITMLVALCFVPSASKGDADHDDRAPTPPSPPDAPPRSPTARVSAPRAATFGRRPSR